MSNIKDIEEIILAKISPEALKTIQQRVLETGGEITRVMVQVRMELPDGSSETITVNPSGKLNIVFNDPIYVRK